MKIVDGFNKSKSPLQPRTKPGKLEINVIGRQYPTRPPNEKTANSFKCQKYLRRTREYETIEDRRDRFF